METPRTHRTPRRALTAALALSVVLTLTACASSGGADDERPTPEEAAEVITSGFGLDGDAGGCLRERFAADGGEGARTAMVRGSRASDDQRQALAGVLDACITAESFADAVAAAVAAGVPGATPERDACVRGEIEGLDPAERSTLMLGLLLSGDLQLDELQVERARITQDVYDACDVTPSTDPPGTTVAAPG
jgi:hypothetical protein